MTFESPLGFKIAPKVKQRNAWWITSTLQKSDAVLVDQPKGATSRTDSYRDRSGNGNHATDNYVDAYGNAYTLPEERRMLWLADYGWRSTAYSGGSIGLICLPVGLYPYSNWSLFYVTKNVTWVYSGGEQARGFGVRYTGGNRFYAWNNYLGSVYIANGDAAACGAKITDGDLCLSGTTFGVVAGVQYTPTFSGFTGAIERQMVIGTWTDGTFDLRTNLNPFIGDVTCFALWNRPLTWQEYLDVRAQAMTAGLL